MIPRVPNSVTFTDDFGWLITLVFVIGAVITSTGAPSFWQLLFVAVR